MEFTIEMVHVEPVSHYGNINEICSVHPEFRQPQGIVCVGFVLLLFLVVINNILSKK